jgi:hypothetical protein
MYKYIYPALGLICSNLIAHAGTIDVYGLNKVAASHLLQKFGKPIYETEKFYWQRRLEKKLSFENEQVWRKKQQNYIDMIKQFYGFQTVLIESVYYPDAKEIFTTISLDKAPSYQPKIISYQVKSPPDLLDRLLAFIPKATQFVIEHPEYANALNCLDYHCITPEHPFFKTDLSYFRREVPLQKKMILHELSHSPDLQRRRAAIFALGYLKEAQEIVSILEDNLTDPSTLIRHDCLRVYGELLTKAPKVNVHIEKILPSIFSVYEAERNKALIILTNLVKQSRYKGIIDAKARQQLMSLAQLKQPNNHDFAVEILQELNRV